MTTVPDSARQRTDPPEDPPPPDQAAWEEAATKGSIEQLQAVRGTAEKWAGTVTTLLGIFSSVAVVTGVDALADVRWPDRWLLVALIAAAGVAAAVAIIAAALAAQGVLPKERPNWDGDALRAWVTSETPKAVRKLRVARFAGFAAAALVFLVGLASLVSSALPEETGSGPSVVVIGPNDSVICGELVADESGVVSVAGVVISVASQIIEVEGC